MINNWKFISRLNKIFSGWDQFNIFPAMINVIYIVCFDIYEKKSHWKKEKTT